MSMVQLKGYVEGQVRFEVKLTAARDTFICTHEHSWRFLSGNCILSCVELHYLHISKLNNGYFEGHATVR